MVETEPGVRDATPGTEGPLERLLLERLANAFPDSMVRTAPLAINRRGDRWTAVRYVPALVENEG
jgi:hypothetical protein